jgi:hypothetical protein
MAAGSLAATHDDPGKSLQLESPLQECVQTPHWQASEPQSALVTQARSQFV